MGSILEDLYDHEGYGARRLPDGTVTAGWTAETAAFDSYVAACRCGWHGNDHPATEDGYEAAVDEWAADHARPLLAETVPAAVTRAIADARQVVAALARQRPEAARRALDELGECCVALQRKLDRAPVESGADRMRRQLDALADQRRDTRALRRP